MPSQQEVVSLVAIVLGIGVLLLVILLPLSFSYIEYYEFGLKQSRVSKKVYTDKVFAGGRYVNGVSNQFLKYQADAHFMFLDDLEVFSAGAGSNSSIGLDFKLDVFLTYMLIQDEVGVLHQELARGYNSVITSRARDAIKNEAIFVSFDEFFKKRVDVEKRFREAVIDRWNAPPSVHVTLDQFHLGRIRIPDSVARKQLDSRLQNERNDMEDYLQEATLERQYTAVAVNTINLQQDNILRTATAEADLIRSKAIVEANEIKNQAQLNGTKTLVAAAGIETQDHKTAFTYIRNLMNREDLDIDVSYLTSENIIKTREV